MVREAEVSMSVSMAFPLRMKYRAASRYFMACIERSVSSSAMCFSCLAMFR